MTTVVVDERLLLFCDTNGDAVWCNILRIFGGEVCAVQLILRLFC